MKACFQQLAAYNQWANARIYHAALALSEESYRRPTGIFFNSLHGTLNHLLVTDRIWLKRITGQGEHPVNLDAIIHEDRIDLAKARVAEDLRIIAVVDACAPEAFAHVLVYRNTRGTSFEQPLQDILLHFFLHQTHHRGQAHAGLSIVTGSEPPSLDMVAFQRGLPAPELRLA